MLERQAIIAARNLCKTYSAGNEQYHAVRNVDLDIHEGEFTVIMGNSGSGKSSLLYLLSGLDNVTAGEVYFRDRRIDQFGERELSDFRAKNIGYIYQSINLVPDLTIWDNITLPGYIAGQKKETIATRARELAHTMGIEGQLGRLPSQTSGGQQQRAAIARALINSPDVLFADEPTGSLNYDQGVAVLDLLSRMNKDGQTVVMVTHDIKAACRADRLIYIRDGKIGGILEFGMQGDMNTHDREALIFSFVSQKVKV
ncbi:ABC transporter ATP-binding protein [Paenibacillus sp. PAMC21692]|uniref:ABC transporter ATP-binding protein n=1 Tax=Paenibacillus sp. PAMC21692 TaxID=2762320 RepID=UPI00164E19C4|nr:ABC transporter ATP-binding protein [Paenibacillus sp. PAMC21692]QNK60364.1 ABC transporter ATP-binding protein [Paenibacillus sp. PAMC21692]